MESVFIRSELTDGWLAELRTYAEWLLGGLSAREKQRCSARRWLNPLALPYPWSSIVLDLLRVVPSKGPLHAAAVSTNTTWGGYQGGKVHRDYPYGVPTSFGGEPQAHVADLSLPCVSWQVLVALDDLHDTFVAAGSILDSLSGPLLPVGAKAGDVLCFDSRLPHKGAANDGERRTTLLITYTDQSIPIMPIPALGADMRPVRLGAPDLQRNFRPERNIIPPASPHVPIEIDIVGVDHVFVEPIDSDRAKPIEKPKAEKAKKTKPKEK